LKERLLSDILTIDQKYELAHLIIVIYRRKLIEIDFHYMELFNNDFSVILPGNDPRPLLLQKVHEHLIDIAKLTMIIEKQKEPYTQEDKSFDPYLFREEMFNKSKK